MAGDITEFGFDTIPGNTRARITKINMIYC